MAGQILLRIFTFISSSVWRSLAIAFSLGLVVSATTQAQDPEPPHGEVGVDLEFREYFETETRAISDSCLTHLSTLDEWKSEKPEMRRQLFEMLGLDPLPPKTDLKPTITQVVEGDGFEVRSVHFQSRPGLYVTGNLYVPDQVGERLPAILYLCGHGAVRKDGVSYGNKVHYHHHGAWFAQNGYVCLTIDSLQLGEIEGIHHGTHNLDMWWWLNRGYTPAGVEAWNCIRALDYLQTLEEVNPEKIGVTGRSGGGAYSWWIAALDDRIKVAVPVAGITDLQNHVVDDCIEGHCDCMFMVNTYRWDYPMLAAMVAPRPLLISNSDRDRIFPLDGVYRTFNKVRKVYELYGKPDDIGLHITAGPHQDSQELRVHAFRWFNHYLKGTDDPVRMPAEATFEPEQLRVFQSLPDDSINAKIHDTFVTAAVTPDVPEDAQQWRELSEEIMNELREKTFGGWPEAPCKINVKRVSGGEPGAESLVEEYRFESQSGVTLAFRMTRPPSASNQLPVVVNVGPWGTSDLADQSVVQIEFVPRGLSQTVAPNGETQQVPIHVKRRYYLLGQSLDGMRVYDIRRLLAAVREVLGDEDVPIVLVAKEPRMQLMCAFAALFEQDVKRVVFPSSAEWGDDGPYLLNVARVLTPPMLAAMLGDHCRVYLDRNEGAADDHGDGAVGGEVIKDGVGDGLETWEFPVQIDRLLKRKSFVEDLGNGKLN